MKILRAVPFVLAVSACSSLPSPAGAQEVIRDGDPRIINVDATATVRRAPDRAVIQLAVETPAQTAQAAMRQNADAMDRVIAAVRRLGVEPRNIQTGRISLNPRYDHRRDPREPAGEPTIVGYVAHNSVIVTLDSIPLVGRVIDAAVEAGANRATGISFQIRDPEAAHGEALRMAIERATRQARLVAGALGETLGPPLRVNTSGWHAPPRPMPQAMEMAMRATADAPTPVEPGEIDVQAHVSITFRIGT